MSRTEPTDEQLAEIRAALDKARAAQARGEDPRALYEQAEALMRKYHAAEEPPPGTEEDDPVADPAALALAIATARAEGDKASVKKLEAMLPAATS